MGDEPFVGRTLELARLSGWVDEARDTGVGRFVLVTGEAGGGKTRLCAEFDRRLAARGVMSVWSRCWDAGGGPPLWPWPDLLRELGDRGMGHPDDTLAGSAGERFGLFQSVLDNLRAACSSCPVVIVLDDLHVANHDVVTLTRFIARAVHRFPLLLVATWRVEPASGDVTTARFESVAREATVLELGAFGEAELVEYLRCCGREGVSSADVGRLLVLSGGNPMLVSELVRDGPSVAGHPGSRGLAVAIERRVAALSEGDRALLGAAAVAGDGARVVEFARIVGCSAEDVAAAVGRSGSAATIVDGRLRFSHGLLRDAFAAALPEADRLALHLAALDAGRGVEPDQVVWRARHAVEAASLSVQHTATAVAACAEAAVVLQRALAFEQAIEWAATGCRLAIDGSPPDVHADLLLVHAEVVLASGRLVEARRLFDRAVDAAERAGNGAQLAAATLGVGGVWVEEQRDELSRRRLLCLCRRALVELPPDAVVLAARLGVRLAAELAYDSGSLQEMREAVATVRQLGDAAATAEALCLLHHTLLGPEHAAERLRVADELLEVAVSARGTIYPLFGLCWRTIDLYLIASAGAERSLVELRDRTDALGCRSIGYIVAVLDVMRAIRRGDLDEAEVLAAEALRFGETVGDADALAYYGGHLLAIRWLQGRLDEMRDLVNVVIESSTLRHRDVSYTAVLGLVCAVDGDARAARAAIDDAVSDGLDVIGVPSNRMVTWTILVEAVSVLGDAALAAELALAMEPFAHLPVMPSLSIACIGPGARVMGVACATAGRRDEAVVWFRAALLANQRIGNGPVDAIIRAELADVLRHGSSVERSEAAGLYAEAISRATGFGMTRRVSEWSAAAATLGSPVVATPRRGTFERCPTGWRIDIDGRAAAVDDVIGLRYIADLLARPDTDVRAVELAAAVRGFDVAETAFGAPRVDEQARRAYERRIADLDRELDTADVLGDVERGRRAAEERQIVVDHLRREFGLARRPRRTSDDDERCRMSVSKAIHRAIRRIREADPVVGRVLDTGLHTGYVCRYVTDPGEPIVWTVRTGAGARPLYG
jgi:tetratricopeptide (TPR) repeat protein